MRIRQARMSDVDSIYKLGRNEFKDEGWFTKKSLGWDLKSNTGICWVLEDRKEIIGARMFSEAGGGTAWGWLILIRSNLRNNRLGMFLFDECCKRLKGKGFNRIVTDVSKRNVSSIKWHKKAGYERLGTVKDWFYKGHDAIIFCKYL